MKITVPIFIRDNGDGSYSAIFFNSIKDRDDYEAAVEDDPYGCIVCDAADELEIEVDVDGNILNGNGPYGS